MTTTLTAQQLRQLDALKDRHTLYEAEIVHPDGRRALLAYCGARSKRGLRDAIWKRGRSVVAFLSMDEEAEMKPVPKCPMHTHKITGGGMIRFTGRTKRDVVMEGRELPYVGSEG